jgi:hypothetical protein
MITDTSYLWRESPESGAIRLGLPGASFASDQISKRIGLVKAPLKSVSLLIMPCESTIKECQSFDHVARRAAGIHSIAVKGSEMRLACRGSSSQLIRGGMIRSASSCGITRAYTSTIFLPGLFQRCTITARQCHEQSICDTVHCEVTAT